MGIERTYGGKQRGELAKMMPAFVGYVARFGALSDCHSEAELLEVLKDYLGRYAKETHVSTDSSHLAEASKFGTAVIPPPDYEGVASVLVSIALRIVNKNLGPKGGLRAQPGVLPSLDGGTSGGGLVDRGPDGQTPGLCESARSWRDHRHLRSRHLWQEHGATWLAAVARRRLRRVTFSTSSSGNLIGSRETCATSWSCVTCSTSTA